MCESLVSDSLGGSFRQEDLPHCLVFASEGMRIRGLLDGVPVHLRPAAVGGGGGGAAMGVVPQHLRAVLDQVCTCSPGILFLALAHLEQVEPQPIPYAVFCFALHASNVLFRTLCSVHLAPLKPNFYSFSLQETR